MSNKFIYYARISYNQHRWEANFPDIPDIKTNGNSFDNAVKNARQELKRFLQINDPPLEIYYIGEEFYPIAITLE